MPIDTHSLEVQVITRAVNDLVAAGYVISVNDGQEIVVRGSVDTKTIMAALFSVDEERLIARQPGVQGSILLIHGNDGYDVIADYSLSLESALEGANKLADRLSE